MAPGGTDGLKDGVDAGEERSVGSLCGCERSPSSLLPFLGPLRLSRRVIAARAANVRHLMPPVCVCVCVGLASSRCAG